MKNREIGHIITKGGSVEDIRKVIPKFPANPTKDTFVKLGYAESTAKRYYSLLEQNSSKKVTENAESQAKAHLNELTNIIQSDNADYDNILVDTCALSSANCRKIIDNAAHVTFTFATLEEMDRKKAEAIKRKKQVNDDLAKLAKHIPVYTSKILTSPEKYMVSKFRGHSDEGYVDNVLLQYLEILPKQIRPTLLTRDRNLAAKAASLEFNYIFIDTNDSGENDKKLGYGITLYKRNGETYVIYIGTQTLELHRRKKVILCTEKTKVLVQHDDILCLNQKSKKHILKHIIEID